MTGAASRSTGAQNAQMDLIADLVAQGAVEFVGYSKRSVIEIVAVLDSGALV